MSEIHIRAAQPSDITFLFDSYKQAAEEQHISHRFQHTQESLEKAIFEDHLADVLIAEKDNQPLGFTFYSLTTRNFTLHLKPGMFVHTLYVNQPHRRQKIATKLMTAVKDIAKTKGCGRIDLMVFKANINALHLLKTDFEAQEVDAINYMRITL